MFEQVSPTAPYGCSLNLDLNISVAQNNELEKYLLLFKANLSLISCIDFYFQSRERLLGTLRAMNAGDAAEQVIRQVEKLARNAERASRDARFLKVEST